MNRIEGHMSADGTAYEVWHGGALLKSTPIEEARGDKKHQGAIARNKWGKLE